MLGRVRLRLALLFLLITTIVWLVTSGAGVCRFWIRMNAVLDEEISTLASETLARVSYAGGKPFLDVPPNIKFHQHVSIQLYDANGTLLQSFGDPGKAALSKNPEEVVTEQNIRYKSMTFPLAPGAGKEGAGNSQTDGYLQLQVSTTQRDVAIHNYLENILFLAPVLLLGLSIAGSFFARWAVRPIETAMLALKRFIADSSHELATPLVILRTTTDNLSLDVAGMPEAEGRVETLIRAMDRMSKLVADMTHLARVEAAEMSMERQNLQLDDLVKDTVESFKELSAEKNLTLNCNTESAMVKGDKGAIERLMVNLLQNAMRYTDDGGTVSVSLAKNDNNACLTVSDTGIGIPADALPHIFERFYRVDKARSRAAGGSGLGLAIVKATAEAYGGSVSASSEEGKGTKFTVMLPLVSRN